LLGSNIADDSTHLYPYLFRRRFSFDAVIRTQVGVAAGGSAAETVVGYFRYTSWGFSANANVFACGPTSRGPIAD
jgi:hypothetical protein